MDIQEGNNYMINKLFFKGIDSRASNRFHYCSGTDTLVEVNTIFFDQNHKINSYAPSIGDRFNLIPLEYIFRSSYGSYFKDYILEDLFYLGYIDRKGYLAVKFCVDITESSIFKNAIKCFIENNRAKLPRAELHASGEVWTNNMEIVICNLVIKKYYSDEEVNKRNGKKDLDNLMKVYDENNLIPDDYTISWNSYFMGIAQLVKKRSKDPVCKVGACIIRDNKILSTGYNGFPRGIDDSKYPWSKDSDDPTKNKFFYVVHAELNAILNSDTPVTDSKLYVTKFPCNECAKAIIQSGIKKIIYNDDKDDSVLFNIEKNKITLSMLNDAQIEVARYCPIGYNELIRL